MRARLVTAFLVLFSLGCDQGIDPGDRGVVPPSGALSLSLAKSSIPSEVKLVSARLERSGFSTIRDSVFISANLDTVKLLVRNVPAGTWSVTVEARDSLSQVRYSGKGNVIVVVGQTTQLVIYMSPVPATTGGIEIRVVWPAAGFQWNIHSQNPIFQQTSGYWDAQHFFFDDPTIVKLNNVYHMWYATATSQSVNGSESFWIAYATSPDGISWTKRGAVVHPGSQGSWMQKGVLGPTVIYDQGIFKMWFEGQSGSAYHNGIGYATSSDGMVWTIRPDPVVPTNSQRPTTWHPDVLKRDGTYYLFFSVSSSPSINPKEMYLMTSTDGITWTDRGKILTARPGLSWESGGIVAPQVIVDGNKYRMIYTALTGTSSSLGYAESTNGIAWQQVGSAPILTTLQTVPWSTTWVGYSYAMKEGNTLRLWFSGLTAQPYRWQIGYAECLE